MKEKIALFGDRDFFKRETGLTLGLPSLGDRDIIYPEVSQWGMNNCLKDRTEPHKMRVWKIPKDKLTNFMNVCGAHITTQSFPLLYPFFFSFPFSFPFLSFLSFPFLSFLLFPPSLTSFPSFLSFLYYFFFIFVSFFLPPLPLLLLRNQFRTICSIRIS